MQSESRRASALSLAAAAAMAAAACAQHALADNSATSSDAEIITVKTPREMLDALILQQGSTVGQVHILIKQHLDMTVRGVAGHAEFGHGSERTRSIRVRPAKAATLASACVH